jgi:hypothetical protein
MEWWKRVDLGGENKTKNLNPFSRGFAPEFLSMGWTFGRLFNAELVEAQVKGAPTFVEYPFSRRNGWPYRSKLEPFFLISIPYNPQILLRNKTDWYQIALKYQQKIFTGKVKSKAELARKTGVSRARITQIMNRLKND